MSLRLDYANQMRIILNIIKQVNSLIRLINALINLLKGKIHYNLQDLFTYSYIINSTISYILHFNLAPPQFVTYLRFFLHTQ